MEKERSVKKKEIEKKEDWNKKEGKIDKKKKRTM